MFVLNFIICIGWHTTKHTFKHVHATKLVFKKHNYWGCGHEPCFYSLIKWHIFTSLTWLQRHSFLNVSEKGQNIQFRLCVKLNPKFSQVEILQQPEFKPKSVFNFPLCVTIPPHIRYKIYIRIFMWNSGCICAQNHAFTTSTGKQFHQLKVLLTNTWACQYCFNINSYSSILFPVFASDTV